ncbi:hypothetical protein DPMN_040184 [Dreissena polymorpha]|uniref:Uncharacterized protein n=1 Tax=Dreissena polymorpha TaxID=45954 RepID=A0A9D4HST7_DREPO|nr:hypothetical protein DPMN_040141 [Dreissena polymorpha]KAH3733750.1 hypothetical protein DPMN_040184 [Dreissena polymorpha]
MIAQEVHREQRARKYDWLGNPHPPGVRLIAAWEGCIRCSGTGYSGCSGSWAMSGGGATPSTGPSSQKPPSIWCIETCRRMEEHCHLYSTA